MALTAMRPKASVTCDPGNLPTQMDVRGAAVIFIRHDGKLAEKTSTTQTFFEDFDTKDTAAWAYSSYQIVPTPDPQDTNNKVVKSTGQSSWAANFYRSTYNLSPGKIVQVDFKVDAANPNSVICVEASSGGTYYRWGITINDGNIYAQYNDGTGYHTAKNLIPGFELNTWYVLVLKIDDDADSTGELFRTEVYKKGNPAIRGYYTLDMPDGLSWRFHHWIWSGNSYLDNYYERSIGSDVVYDGNLYEKDLRAASGSQETRYYYYEGKRVATRQGGMLSYLLSDHLGSPVSSYRASDGAMQEMRYLSYGGSRLSPGGLPTARLYTGQLLDDSTGLYSYGARWYDSRLGRFISPDSVVPRPGNPQSLNRYTYALGNPLRYSDPTGHDILEDTGYFVRGAVTQWTYDNAWWNPQAQQALAVQPNEPEAMRLGRHAGNAVAMVQSAAEMTGGAAMTTGGAVACGTGVLCVAGAPAVVGGVAVAGHGVGVGGTAAYQEGQLLSEDYNQFNAQGTAEQGATGSRRLPFTDQDRVTEVNKTLDRIESGNLKYPQDGATFRNREQLLPGKNDPNYYTEYTVDTPGLTNRGERRIVVGRGGEVYYSDEHYRSFIQIDPRRY